MSKRDRGLPADFDLEVPESVVLTRKPIQLDDYLERELKGEEKQPQAAPGSAPAPAADPAAPTPLPAARVLEPGLAPPLFITRHKVPRLPAKPPRVQVNMSPETRRAIPELVNHLSTYSAQRDIAASEMFEALVSALHEARDQLDLSNIPPRGQWGSPNARAFRTNLKNAIIEAIARHYQRLAGE